MKKLFFIFFVLLFTTNVQALVFEKCYFKQSGVTKFEKDKFEKFKYPIYTDKVVEKVIYTDSFLKEINDKHEEFIKSERAKGYNTPYFYKEKIEEQYFDLKYVDEKYVKVERLEFANNNLTTIKFQKTFDLTTGEVSSETFFEYASGGRNKSPLNNVMKCLVVKSKSRSGSSYFDYWWAVILIIAITFFIFTQSGKRLKKIRRK